MAKQTKNIFLPNKKTTQAHTFAKIIKNIIIIPYDCINNTNELNKFLGEIKKYRGLISRLTEVARYSH